MTDRQTRPCLTFIFLRNVVGGKKILALERRVSEPAEPCTEISLNKHYGRDTIKSVYKDVPYIVTCMSATFGGVLDWILDLLTT
jgi:hypothetical protein